MSESINNHPFNLSNEEIVASLGEIHLIEEIGKILGPVSPAYPEGMGDDCAVLNDEKWQGKKRLVTTDSLIYSKHFDDSVSAFAAGEKLIKRNLSDIAAMGGIPADAVLSIIMSNDVKKKWFFDFIKGVASAAEKYQLLVVGGDLASVSESFFSANLSLTGYAKKPLLRKGANVGDVVFVTGELGGSLSGHHYLFSPRLLEGQFLASLENMVKSSIDISDGLMKDHQYLLSTGEIMDFDFDKIPISSCVKDENRTKRLISAFCDGEDYELLFVVDATAANFVEEKFQKKFPNIKLSRIAKIMRGDKNENLYNLIPFNAYEHFQKNESLSQKR